MEPGSFYENIQMTPTKNSILLTKKTAKSSKKIRCEIRNNKISSCRNVEDGNYKMIPDENQYIYKFEPELKRLMICAYDPNNSSTSNCLPIISEFHIAAENMTFVQGNKSMLLTDIQEKSFLYCKISSENYKFSLCTPLKTDMQPASTAVILNKSKPSTPAAPNNKIQDGLTFSSANRNLFLSCNATVNKKFLCRKNNSEKFSGLPTPFIKDYLPENATTSQYAYLLDIAGLELTECSFSPDKILSGIFRDCKPRRDINLPVKIISGKVWSAENMLLLIDKDSTIYQCDYDEKNRLKTCKNAGMSYFKATQIAFDSAHKKIYFYSQKTRKLSTCNLSNRSIENCFSISTDDSIANDDIQEILMSPDHSDILLSGKSIIHHCSIDNEMPRLKNCVDLSDNFSNISSLAYSKTNQHLLYVLDNKIMKSCYINSGKIKCSATNLGNNLSRTSVNRFYLSANYLQAGINLLPVTIKNNGDYTLRTTYKTWKTQQEIASKRLLFTNSIDAKIMAGSPVGLHVVGGKKKCFLIDDPGSITCKRSITNTECYYETDQGEQKKVYDGACSADLLGSACTPKLLDYIKTSGHTSGGVCKDDWDVDLWRDTIKTQCARYVDRCVFANQCIYQTSSINCHIAKKAMDAGIPINDFDGGELRPGPWGPS